MSNKKDFFISYNGKDQNWAEWVAWEVEQMGYSTIIQAWDFNAGGNFVNAMQEAAKNAERTIAVLSQNYLDAQFTHPEWHAAFRQDPKGEKGLLIPVRIAECDLDGLLSQIIYIDLVGVDENQAGEKLREQLESIITGKRRRPEARPSFPGVSSSENDRPAPPPPTITPAPPVKAVPNTSTETNKTIFLNALKGMLSSQFEEVFFHAGIQSDQIAPGAQNVRAMAIIKYSESAGELDKLENAIQTVAPGVLKTCKAEIENPN
jgi:hypothetical protein